MSAPTAAIPASQLLQLPLDEIRLDGGTQTRAHLDEDTLATYGEALAAGATFPDVIVFFDGVSKWLADGFHRVETYRRAGRAKINALVRSGTQRDAVLYAAGANGKHGLPRTREDKRRAVLLLLADPEWRGWADREIARQCCVTHPFVSKLRESGLTGNNSGENGDTAAPEQHRTYKTRHGSTATMRVRKHSANGRNGSAGHKRPCVTHARQMGEGVAKSGELSLATVGQGDMIQSSAVNVLDTLPQGAIITIQHCAVNCWRGKVSDGRDMEANDLPGLIAALAATFRH